MLEITRLSRLPATGQPTALPVITKCHSMTTACILRSTAAMLGRHGQLVTRATSRANFQLSSFHNDTQEEQYEYWDEDIPTEDYTWSGDRELDVFDEEPSTHHPMLDLTRPSTIDTVSGLEAEEQLAIAMEAIYHGMHSEDTVCTREPTPTTDAIEQQGGQLDPKLLRMVFGAGIGTEKPDVSPDVLPPVPPRFIGNVEVKDIQGCGWGIVTTELMEAGDTLLISEPIAVHIQMPGTPSSFQPVPDREAAQQNVQTTQEHADMPALLAHQVQHMQGSLPSQHPMRNALSCLCQGPGTREASEHKETTRHAKAKGRREGFSQRMDPGDMDANKTQLLIPIDIHSWQPPELMDDMRTSVASSSHSLKQRRPSQTELQRVIKYNAFVNLPSDRAISTLRQEPPVMVSGLWPELAMINHSCAPNATAVLCGGRVIVRAATRILPGAEVTFNYLPVADALQPAEHRRALLKQHWGFICKCERCKLELSGEHRLSDALSSAHTAATELQHKMQSVLSQWNLKVTNAAQITNITDSIPSEESTQSQMKPLQLSQQADGSSSSGTEMMMSPDMFSSMSINKPDMRKASGSRNILQGVYADSQASELSLPDELMAELRSIEADACGIRDEVHALIASMMELRHTPSAVEQVLAGMHAVYDVIAAVRTLTAPGSTLMLAAWEMLTTTATAALPGSEVCTLGNAYLARVAAERYGVSDRRALIAERVCIRAFHARYGPCTPATLQALIDSGLEVVETSMGRIWQGQQASLKGDTTGLSGTPMTCDILRWAPPAWEWDANTQQNINPSSTLSPSVTEASAPAVLTERPADDVMQHGLIKHRSQGQGTGAGHNQKSDAPLGVRKVDAGETSMPAELEQQLAELLLGKPPGDVSAVDIDKPGSRVEGLTNTDIPVQPTLTSVKDNGSGSQDMVVESTGTYVLTPMQSDSKAQVQPKRSNMKPRRSSSTRLRAADKRSQSKTVVEDEELHGIGINKGEGNTKPAGWMDAWQ